MMIFMKLSMEGILTSWMRLGDSDSYLDGLLGAGVGSMLYSSNGISMISEGVAYLGCIWLPRK